MAPTDLIAGRHGLTATAVPFKLKNDTVLTLFEGVRNIMIQMPDISEHDRKYLESTGIENVRIALLSNTGLALDDRGVAWRWLNEQDQALNARKRRYAQWNLAVTIIGAIAAIVAAGAGIWTIFR